MSLADFVGSLPREEQVRLADKFNEAFSGEDFGCESFANHPLGRTESMSDDLRCSCGFAEKIEAALQRIADYGTTLTWDIMNATLDLYDGRKCIEQTLVADPCSLPRAVISTADKVKPPKQKERERRVGDVVAFSPIDKTNDLYEHGRPEIITATQSNKFHTRLRPNISGVGHNPKQWRNLTIEAEQAGEKSETPECGFGYTNP